MLKVLHPDKVDHIPFPFDPYFYVDDPTTGKREKVECTTPTKQREILDICRSRAMETYEGDIPYTRRVMMDLEWKVTAPEKYLIYDIEVDAGDEFPEPSIAKNRILSICAMDQDGTEFVFCDQDEALMVEDFLALATKYRIIGGWNSMRFDWPYIKNRATNWLGIRVDEFQIIDLDFLAMYRFVTLVEKASFSLDNIAKVEEIGIRKVEVEVSKLKLLMENDPEKLIEYNMTDVKMVAAIEKKYMLVNFLFAICESCHTLPREHFYLDQHGIGRMSVFQGVETILIKNANRKGIHVPTRKDNSPPTYVGGMVMEPPRKGVVDNVAIIDFSSLYPNIMRAFNIGPDTYRDDKSGGIDAPIGSFTNETTSYVVDTIDELMHLKTEMGKAKAMADPDTFEGKAMIWRYHSIKVVINSLFGATGFHKSRVYKYECCQNVQSIERLVLPETIRGAEDLGFEVVGADTDSIFVVVKDIDEAKELATKLNVRVNEWAKKTFNVMREGCFDMDVEKFFSSMMIIAKKKYAGVVIHDGSKDTMFLYKRGLESVRHDWPLAVKEFQDKLLLKMLLRKDWRSYIKDIKEKFYDGSLDDRMAIYKTLKKPVEEYNNMPPHVRAASMAISSGAHVRVGDKIGYLKYGPRSNDILLANPYGRVDIQFQQRSYLWSKMFEPIINRFQVQKNMTLDQWLS